MQQITYPELPIEKLTVRARSRFATIFCFPLFSARHVCSERERAINNIYCVKHHMAYLELPISNAGGYSFTEVCHKVTDLISSKTCTFWPSYGTIVYSNVYHKEWLSSLMWKMSHPAEVASVSCFSPFLKRQKIHDDLNAYGKFRLSAERLCYCWYLGAETDNATAAYISRYGPVIEQVEYHALARKPSGEPQGLMNGFLERINGP